MNMNAGARLFGFGIVAALSVCAARAMDMSQQHVPAGDGTPALTLPAFLDISRLPDMQDAWRLHAGAAATRAAKADDEAMEAAREAMTRAEQINRNAAATRARAEELSRRFESDTAATDPAIQPVNAEPATAQDTAAPPAAPPPTETASIDAADAPADAPFAPPTHLLGPGNDPLAGQDAAGQDAPNRADAAPAVPVEVPTRKPAPKKKTAAVDGAPVIEDMATKPPKQFGGVANARQIGQAATAKPSTPGLVVFEDSPTQPEHDPNKMLPTELRAFGWGNQP